MLAEKIGLQLKEIRIGLRLSQTEFATKMNVASSTISKYELGKTTPDCIFLNRLHEQYGVDIGRLVTGEPQLPQSKSGGASNTNIDEAVFYAVMDTAMRYGYYSLPKGDTSITFAQEIIEEYERVLSKKRR